MIKLQLNYFFIGRDWMFHNVQLISNICIDLLLIYLANQWQIGFVNLEMMLIKFKFNQKRSVKL